MSDDVTNMRTRGAFPRVATVAAEAAIEAGSGVLFEAIIDTICRLNAEIKRDVATKIIRELLGPIDVEDLFEGWRRITVLPGAVKIDGRWAPILETEPLTVMLLSARLGALWAATCNAFGGFAGYQQLRAVAVAEGGDPAMADETLLRDYNNERREIIEAVRREASLAPVPSAKRFSGCATSAVLALLSPLAFMFVLLEWLCRT